MPNVAVNMRDSRWLLGYFREENVKVGDVLFGAIETLPSAGAMAQKLVVFSALTPTKDQSIIAVLFAQRGTQPYLTLERNAAHVA